MSSYIPNSFKHPIQTTEELFKRLYTTVDGKAPSRSAFIDPYSSDIYKDFGGSAGGVNIDVIEKQAKSQQDYVNSDAFSKLSDSEKAEQQLNLQQINELATRVEADFKRKSDNYSEDQKLFWGVLLLIAALIGWYVYKKKNGNDGGVFM